MLLMLSINADMLFIETIKTLLFRAGNNFPPNVIIDNRIFKETQAYC